MHATPALHRPPALRAPSAGRSSVSLELAKQLARAVGVLIGKRIAPTDRKRGDRAQHFSQLRRSAGIEFSVGAAGDARDFAEHGFDAHRWMVVHDTVTIIDVDRQTIAFLKEKHRHAETSSGGVERAAHFLHRIADEYRGGD